MDLPLCGLQCEALTFRDEDSHLSFLLFLFTGVEKQSTLSTARLAALTGAPWYYITMATPALSRFSIEKIVLYF